MAHVINRHLYGISETGAKIWVQQFLDCMAAAGWVQTSDTGQIDVSSITLPAPASIVAKDLGYAVFVQDDVFRATDPVYLRAQFWVAAVGHTLPRADYHCFQANLTVGFSTDGAGAITGDKFSTGMHANGGGYNTNQKTALNVFAGGPGWTSIAHGIGSAYYDRMLYVRQICAIFIERQRDAYGTVIPGELYIIAPESGRQAHGADGYMYTAFKHSYSGARDNYGGTLMLGHFLKKGGGLVTGMTCVAGIIGSPTTTGTVQGVVQAQPVWRGLPQIAPFLGLVLVPTAVFLPGQVFTATVDGVNEQSYAALGSVNPLSNAAAKDAVGGMYVIDGISGADFCFAARVA